MTTPTEWDLVVVGGANVDYLVRGPKLPSAGETALGEEFHQGPGGKGANQAVAAARLGARVAFVARLGNDRQADELADSLHREGVDTRFVVRDPTTPTGVALIMVEARGEKQIFVAPGANLRLAPEDISTAFSATGGVKAMLTQLEVPLETVAAAMKAARGVGARVVLDPAPAVPLADELLAMVDVIRPNAGEAEILTGVRVTDRATARRAARQLLDRGVQAAVVQAGQEGNLLVWREGEHFLPRLPVKSVDATGAGDAFAAAMTVLLAEGRSLVEAATFANAAAALATTKVGAQAGLPRREEVLALLSRS